MQYYVCIDYRDEEKVFVSIEEKAEKNDLLVYMDYDGPSLAKIIGVIDELIAITQYDGQFKEGIKFIPMKEYLERKAKEAQKASLVKKMKEQIELAKLESVLLKNAECTPEMATLFEQYKKLSQ